MAVVRIRLEGVNQFRKSLESVGTDAKGRARQAIFNSGQRIRNDILRSFNEPKSGRTYLVPGTQREYVASAPGQAPAVATSQLSQSINTLPERGSDGLALNVGVITKDTTIVEYAEDLEFGTERVAERPFVTPAFDKNLNKNKDEIARALRSALGG